MIGKKSLDFGCNIVKFTNQPSKETAAARRQAARRRKSLSGVLHIHHLHLDGALITELQRFLQQSFAVEFSRSLLAFRQLLHPPEVHTVWDVCSVVFIFQTA